MSVASAAILVIGDEILSGKTDDLNARFLISELRDLGVSLRGIQVIPDIIEEVANGVRLLSPTVDFLFTSGGVGPTHDDVTILGIARAFDVEVVRHPLLEARILAHFGAAAEESRLAMANVPDGSELIEAPDLRWPVLLCHNVYILPGVPELFREKFLAIREMFRVAPFFLRSVTTLEDEFDIAERLNTVVRAFPEVAIGSYPNFSTADFRVKLTLESKNSLALEAAVKALLAALDGQQIVNVE
ncbi:MAG: molybdopterin-binding protein [Acidobacteriota bacterium]